MGFLPLHRFWIVRTRIAYQMRLTPKHEATFSRHVGGFGAGRKTSSAASVVSRGIDVWVSDAVVMIPLISEPRRRRTDRFLKPPADRDVLLYVSVASDCAKLEPVSERL